MFQRNIVNKYSILFQKQSSIWLFVKFENEGRTLLGTVICAFTVEGPKITIRKFAL